MQSTFQSRVVVSNVIQIYEFTQVKSIPVPKLCKCAGHARNQNLVSTLCVLEILLPGAAGICDSTTLKSVYCRDILMKLHGTRLLFLITIWGTAVYCVPQPFLDARPRHWCFLYHQRQSINALNV